MTHRTPPHGLFIFLALIFVAAFSTPSFAMPPLDLSKAPAEPNYSTQEAWLAKPAEILAPVDVFFVYPTVMFNDTDWLMDTTNPDMRKAAMGQVLTQGTVFEGQANIYAPVYRQMNMATLGLSEEESASIYAINHGDVWNAFQHYLKHENNGRPFFLAGHSQGSMILLNLMRLHWGELGAEDRMIAAYLIGWSITDKDLKTNPNMRMCADAEQTGCFIAYNTMAEGMQSQSPTLLPGSHSVNPISWKLDGELAPASLHEGAVFFDKGFMPDKQLPHYTSAQNIDGAVIIHPTDVDLVTVKGGHFPEGIYHAFDYSVFYNNLRTNIGQRIKAFQQ